MNNVEIVVSTLKGGGISNVVKVFARGLQNLNLLSRVTTLQDEFPVEFDSSKVNCLEVSGHASNLLKIFVALRRVLKYRKSSRSTDAKIHFCMDPSSLLVTFISNLNKGHTFISWCATPADLLVLSDRLIIKFMYSKAKVVIVPSQDMKRDLSLINPKANFKVVPNPLTFLEISCNWPRENKMKKVSVLYLGRFSPEKGVDLIPKLANRFPEIPFVMIGDGPMKVFLEKEIASMNLANLKIINWGDPKNYIQESSLLILPSRYESFGLVVVEAWIYGKKVIAAQVASGPKYLIGKHGGGSLVSNYEDLDEWGRLIKENIENELSDQFISHIFETYSGENILNEWLALAGVN